ncbi:hypothetical protein PMAYCL1PPCAC_22997, partial [Pristionchus mayeri]
GLRGSGGRGVSRGSSSGGSGGTTSDSGRDRGDEVGDVDSLEGLGEESRPERLNGDVGGLQEGGDLVSGDGDLVVLEDEGGVDASLLFDGRHLVLGVRCLKP